jgi:hypothetical protein
MNVDDFREKWTAARLKESAGAKEHFLDLCAVLEIEPPAKADPKGKWFCFEKAVVKSDGGKGFADVWRKGCFAWEYKGPEKSLVKAYSQLKEYADALENPPLLIVSDMDEIRIHTNFENAVATKISIKLAEIGAPESLRMLRWAFTDPQSLRPTATRETVTAEAAQRFALIAQTLRERKYDPKRIAHFLNRLVFCMFVEDIGLLPNRIFAEIVEAGVGDRAHFDDMLGELFEAMGSDKGRFGKEKIPWFNGGLFDDADVLSLGHTEMVLLADSVHLDWAAIEPSIFGTLFERGLDPEKRKEMAGLFDGAPPSPAEVRKFFGKPVADRGVGIHYTDPATIMKLIEPVILRPLRAEWAETKKKIAKAKNGTRAKLYLEFRERLDKLRVLDPACGSGNFLYLALTHLKDFDQAVLDDAKALGLPEDQQRIGPDCVLGIEINPYAAELARTTIWIGELQWQLRRGFKVERRPILDTLDTIECRDALLASEGEWEASWPDAEFIVGNPPFLGGKKMRAALKGEYVDRLFGAFRDRVPAEADLVTYWFSKAGAKLKGGSLLRFGFVSTNAIRGGVNRRVISSIVEHTPILSAWSDEPWVIDGAAVRVSIVCFGQRVLDEPVDLNGATVERIHADLTSREADITRALRLVENSELAFMGVTPAGPFDVPDDVARRWIAAPANPNGGKNSEVVRPYRNALDITRRSRNVWTVDFGSDTPMAAAAFFEEPFKHVQDHVKPVRLTNAREAYRTNWWRYAEPRPALRAKVKPLLRCIATPMVSKHRIFVWLLPTEVPANLLNIIARDDDVCFGILHSRLHEIWALNSGTWLGVGNDPRYTPSTTFETFPFPEGLTPNIPAKDYANDPRAKAIAEAAKRLNELRENWLNPEEWVRREPEVVPGFPDRLIPRGAKAEAELKKRTLTNLYNTKPQWLVDAHRALDDAVAAAYGWPHDLTDDEILARLLALNLERAAKQGAAPKAAEPDEDADDDADEKPVAKKAVPKKAASKKK